MRSNCRMESKDVCRILFCIVSLFQISGAATPREGVALSQDGRSCYFFEDATLMTIGESYPCSPAQFRAFGTEYNREAESCSCLQSEDGRLMLSLGGIPRQTPNPSAETPTEGVALSQDGRSCYFFEDATLMTIGESFACSPAQFRAFGVQYDSTAEECTCFTDENGQLMFSYGKGRGNSPGPSDKEGVSLSRDKSRCFFHEDNSLLVIGQPGACSPVVFRAFNQQYTGQTECICNYDEENGQIQLEYLPGDRGGRRDNYDDSSVQLSRNGQRCIFDDNTQLIVGQPGFCSLAVFRGFGKEDDFTGQEIDCVCELHGSSSLHLKYRTHSTQSRGNHGRKRRHRRLRRV